MFENLLGKNGEKKEIDEEELKKLRQQFKEIADENKVQSNNPSKNQESQPKTQDSGNTQQQNPQTNQEQNSTQQSHQYVDPERLEENERITNLIMQQIKELIEIDNNLNVKIKEIETKLKDNISQTQDVKNVVDKFHQRLEFIEKNMEKFMGLYEVVTNRFNPFVEEEQKEKMENPNAKGQINIPENTLEPEEEPQQPAKTQETLKTEEPATPSSIQQNENQETQKEESSETEIKSQQEKAAPPQQQKPAQKEEEESKGKDLMIEAGVKGKLDKEAEEQAIQRLNNLGANIEENKQARLKLIDRTAKGINKLVVDAIKTHSKVSKDQVNKFMDEISGELGIKTQAANNGIPDQEKTDTQQQQTTGQPEVKEEQTQTDTTQQPIQEEITLSNNENQKEEQNKETQKEQAVSENQRLQEQTKQEEEEEASQQQSTNHEQSQEENKSEESMAEKEVSSDLHFKLHDGTEIKSVVDLCEGLKTMGENEFSQHVTEDGNDFALWVGLALNDSGIGEKLSTIKDKQELISELEKIN